MRPVLFVLLLVLLLFTGARAAEASPRYDLAGGCFSVSGIEGPVRFQATALGRYLLMRSDGSFVAAQDGRLGTAEPGPSTDFAVATDGDDTTLTPRSTGQVVARVRLATGTGCPIFPEAPTSTSGTPARGALPWGEVDGLLEGHMHWMTYLKYGGRFQCGRPWHPFGITRALPDCSEVEGPGGSLAPLQNTFNYGSPLAPHDTRGYPDLPSWGRENLTYEGTYWRWVERTWRAGLRLMVMAVNDNRVLCEAQPIKARGCNEMNTVRTGLREVRALEDYVDAQAGGPGKGWFEIVTDPFRAREVINQGRLAVVLEIETSELFDCRGWERPSCDREQVDRGLDEVHRLGVRSLMLLNKFDNPLTGARFDEGTTGYLTNAGNRLSAESFFAARQCRPGELQDNTIASADAPGNAQADEAATTLGLPRGSLPAYPPGPHCNVRGLTELGRHIVRRMIDLGMIVNPDHMSQAAVDDTLTLLESRDYSGVISPHGWVDPGNWARFWKLGGMAFPAHPDADDAVATWRRHRPRETPFVFGWGYGADLGGLSTQPAPSQQGAITYPFKSLDGAVTLDRQQTGNRTFDYATEGVAHYGLYADWIEDLRRVGGPQLAADLRRGAEAYLQMWERAVGIPNKRCFFHKDGITRNGRGPLRLGDDHRAVLRTAGQPQVRSGAWSWCVKGPANTRAADVAVFDDAGRVALVGSTAVGRHARGGRVGARASRLRGTRAAAGGLRLKRDGSRTFVYLVREGRVRMIAVTSTRFARRHSALRRAVGSVLDTPASAAPRRFVPALPSPPDSERAER